MVLIVAINGSSHMGNFKESSYENFGAMIGAMTSQFAVVERVLIRSLTLLQNKQRIHSSSVARNNYSRSRLGNSISRPPQKLELVKIVDKLLEHVGNGGTELKAYKKSRITHPGKHGHNVGSTAFRNWAQGGDGSGEELTIQDDLGSPSVQMTSPAPKTTPQTPPPLPPTPPPSQTPSPTLRATPQVRPPTPASQVQPPTPKDGDGDKQPPPNRSPPYGVASSQAEGKLCFPSLEMIFLFLGAEVCVAAPLIRYKAGTSLSEAAKTLLFVAKILGFAGFLSCLGACIVQRSRRASRMMTAMGCAASFCGFLSIMGMLFPENLMQWLIGALCVLPISAIPFAFKRSV